MEKIAFISDIHFDEQFPKDSGVNTRKNWERIIADLKSRNITQVIFGGDIGAPSSHSYFLQTLKDFEVKIILGNHDEFIHVSKFYNQDISNGELYYFMEDKYNVYLFLDSSSNKIDEKQLTWVREKMKAEKPFIIFIHHPVFEVKTAIDKIYPLLNRDALRAIFESSKQSITLFCGHYHMNDELRLNNIRQIITQASSYLIEKESSEITVNNSVFGYRIIEIEKSDIKTETVTFETM